MAAHHAEWCGNDALVSAQLGGDATVLDGGAWVTGQRACPIPGSLGIPLLSFFPG